MSAALFFGATLATPLVLGLPIVRLPSLKGLSWPARAAIGWSGGVVILSLALTFFSILGIAWRPWMPLVLAAASIVVAAWIPAPRRRRETTAWNFDRVDMVTTGVCVVVAGAALLQLAAGAATSADLSYFWGPKAVHFAVARGIDFQWMQQPHLVHLHPNYPLLWPVFLAWGALLTGSMPWSLVPVLTWMFLLAAALIVHALLTRPLGRHRAALVTCLWFVVLTGSALRSFSGGGAEGPLLLFVTVAVTALVVEHRDERPTLRWLVAGALAGAVLTKSEGTVAAMFVIAGTAIRDTVWRLPNAIGSSARLAVPALAAAGLWAAIRIAHGLPLTDPIREPALHVTFSHLDVIVKTCVRLVGAGTLWVGWGAPLVAAATSRPGHPVRALPGLLVAAGLPVFAAFYYLHATGDPVKLIVWTFPRLIQPAVSAWIVSLGVVCFAARTTPPGGID